MKSRRAAFSRRTQIVHPAVVNELAARQSFNVTELESFATCSSIWFIERAVSPRTIDSESDARLRGSIAHTALHKFFSGLPKRLGIERVEADRVEEAVAFMGDCLDEALESGVWIELTDVDIVAIIAREHRANDHVVLMSNGGFGGIHRRLLQALSAA